MAVLGRVLEGKRKRGRLEEECGGLRGRTKSYGLYPGSLWVSGRRQEIV